MEHLPNYKVISELVEELDSEFNLESRLTRYKSLSPELIELAKDAGMDKEDDATRALFLADFVITSSEVPQGTSDDDRRISIIKAFIEGLANRTYSADNLLKVFYLSQKVAQSFRRNDYFLSGRGLDRNTTSMILKDLYLMPYLAKSKEILGEGGPGWELSILASAAKQTLPHIELEEYGKLTEKDNLLEYIWKIMLEFQNSHNVEINDTLSIPHISESQILLFSKFNGLPSITMTNIHKKADKYEKVIVEDLLNFMDNSDRTEKSLLYIRGKIVGTDETLIVARHSMIDGKPIVVFKTKADEVNVSELLSLLELKSLEKTDWTRINPKNRKVIMEDITTELVDVVVEEEVTEDKEYTYEVEEEVEITEEKMVKFEEEVEELEEYEYEVEEEIEIEEMETYTYEEEIEFEDKPGLFGKLMGKKSKGIVKKIVQKKGKRPVKKKVMAKVKKKGTRPVKKIVKKKEKRPVTRIEKRKVKKKGTRPVTKTVKKKVKKTIEHKVEREEVILEVYPDFVGNALSALSLGDLNLFEIWDSIRESDYGIVGIIYSDFKRNETKFFAEKGIGDPNDLAVLLDGLDEVLENIMNYYFQGEFQIIPSEVLFKGNNDSRYVITFDGNSDRLVGTIAQTYVKDITDWQNKQERQIIKRRTLLMRTGQLLSSLAHSPFDTSVERIYSDTINKESQLTVLDKSILDFNT